MRHNLRLVFRLSVVLLFAWFMCLHVSAAQVVDLTRTDCSITLNLVYRDVTNVEHTMTGGSLAIYTVAVASQNDRGYIYDLSAGKFENQSVVSDVPSMTSEELTSSNASLAQQLSDIVTAQNITPDSVASISNGSAGFTGLVPGLYLIAQSAASDNNRRINPFLISIPDTEGNYTISASPKNSILSTIEGGGDNPPDDNPPEDNPPKDNTPNNPGSGNPPSGGSSGGRLPQTGQLWWPIPVLALAGIALIAIGILRRKKSGSAS